MDRDRIGKYQILGEIGRGTMGEVFRALDPVLGRHVALKTLSTRLAPVNDPEALARFQREAQAAAQLNHPNIVTIHDFGRDGETLYMAMELLEGTDLRDAIDNDLLHGIEAKLKVLDAVLEGLDYAHARGVIHRDIKPANIHLGPGGQVKIMDFGLARMNTSEMTQDGIVVGTPNYMSPEQALGERVDARSDLFSTGAVLYELLTGHKPFEADSTPSVLFQVVHREAPAVTRWAPEVPEPVVAVIERALLKDRDRRYGSAAEMRLALIDAAEGSRARPAPPPLPEGSGASARPSASSPGAPRAARVRRSGLPSALRAPTLPLALGGALLLALLGGGTALWMRGAPAPEPSPAPEARQVGELRRALVATQVQLAQRELEDKNWAAAVTQAESALRLAPGHPEATRALETARARLAELDRAIGEARERLASGDTEAASQQLSHVLELDPRHPAAAELSARLNDEFRSRSDAALASARKARDQARAAGAGGSRAFVAADATVAEATQLAERQEYADATRIFLEARDAFDRARRDTRTPPSESSGERSSTVAHGSVSSSASDLTPSAGPAATAAPARTTAGRLTSTPFPAPIAPPRRFVTDKTTVTTPSAGTLAGFETEEVRTHRQPRFAGHMRFEVLPAEVRPGEPFVVRVHLVNEGKKSIRIHSVELTTIENGERKAAPVKPLRREVDARSDALVAEYSSVWSATGRWVLEAVVSADDDEQVRSRLTSN
jgi:hypothetical protein